MAEAKRADVLIELAPRMGDFVARDDPLFVLRGGGAMVIDESKLLGLVAFGPERTIEQDSTFALRVIVDIAIKALSPAINDPTTAVLAIDQLQRLLRTAGNRNLHNERKTAIGMRQDGSVNVQIQSQNQASNPGAELDVDKTWDNAISLCADDECPTK